MVIVKAVVRSGRSWQKMNNPKAKEFLSAASLRLEPPEIN